MSKRSYTLADKIHALKVYELCEGNLSAAARELEIPRMTLKQWVTNRAAIDELRVTECSSDDEPLRPQHERFVNEHLSGKKGADAARSAGYEGDRDTLASTASRLLRNARIKERIRQRCFSAASLTADEVIGTLADQMRGDVDDLLNDSGFVSLDQARENGVTHLIKKLKYGEFGLSEVEFHSPQTAAIQLSKILGIEQEPAKNKGQLVRRMLEKLIKHGASREQAAKDLVAMAVNEDDVKLALAEIASHESQPV